MRCPSVKKLEGYRLVHGHVGACPCTICADGDSLSRYYCQTVRTINRLSLENFVSDPKSVLSEMLVKYEESVRLQQQELESFRVRASAYTEYLETEIASNLETIEVVKRQLSKSMPATIANPMPSSGEHRQSRTVRIGTRAEGSAASNGQESQSELIRAAAIDILKMERRPLKQAELKQLMDARGLEIRSGDPVELIRAALRRAPEFKHVPRVGYVLADEPKV